MSVLCVLHLQRAHLLLQLGDALVLRAAGVGELRNSLGQCGSLLGLRVQLVRYDLAFRLELRERRGDRQLGVGGLGKLTTRSVQLLAGLFQLAGGAHQRIF